MKHFPSLEFTLSCTVSKAKQCIKTPYQLLKVLRVPPKFFFNHDFHSLFVFLKLLHAEGDLLDEELHLSRQAGPRSVQLSTRAGWTAGHLGLHVRDSEGHNVKEITPQR